MFYTQGSFSHYLSLNEQKWEWYLIISFICTVIKITSHKQYLLFFFFLHFIIYKMPHRDLSKKFFSADKSLNHSYKLIYWMGIDLNSFTKGN